MRIATWNVNSIRARLEHLTGWLRSASPDVVCVQETKVEDALFPEELIGEAGYRAVFMGQKTYNGVAILARFGLSIDDVKRNLDGDGEDAQKRAIAATIEGIRVVNVYVPNGQAVGAPAFGYKLEWLKRLRQEMATHHAPEGEVLLCGDFNVAPTDLDVHDPKRWAGQVLCTDEERAALAAIVDLGFVDAFRHTHPDENGLFSWWDYRMGGFRRNHGLRIDLALLSKPLLARCTGVSIDLEPRRLEKPSDHAPVIVDIAD